MIYSKSILSFKNGPFEKKGSVVPISSHFWTPRVFRFASPQTLMKDTTKQSD